MNIIFNSIYKIDKINQKCRFLNTNSLEFKIISNVNCSIVQLKYNLNDSNYSINLYLKNSHEEDIKNCLNEINGFLLIQKFHCILQEWCCNSLSDIEKSRINLIDVEKHLKEPCEIRYLYDVKKYLPAIVASAIINKIPDGYTFRCERKYFDHSMIDFTNNINDIVSMKFDLFEWKN
jgi:hypothetical protein